MQKHHHVSTTSTQSKAAPFFFAPKKIHATEMKSFWLSQLHQVAFSGQLNMDLLGWNYFQSIAYSSFYRFDNGFKLQSLMDQSHLSVEAMSAQLSWRAAIFRFQNNGSVSPCWGVNTSPRSSEMHHSRQPLLGEGQQKKGERTAKQTYVDVSSSESHPLSTSFSKRLHRFALNAKRMFLVALRRLPTFKTCIISSNVW